MAYVADTFVAGEQPTTAKWNELWGNDASFNDGTGIGAGAIGTSAIATGIQLPDKMKNPYKFSAYQSGAQTIGTTATKVTYNTEEYDTSSNYDNTTNYRFTAPIDGFYYFSALLNQPSFISTEAYAYLSLYKNGSEWKKGPIINVGNGYPVGILVMADIQLSANDYVEVYGTAAGHSIATTGTQSTSQFCGHLISST